MARSRARNRRAPVTGGIQIKAESELRHVLAHLFAAIESILDGLPDNARDELEAVRGLIFLSREECDELVRQQRIAGVSVAERIRQIERLVTRNAKRLERMERASVAGNPESTVA